MSNTSGYNYVSLRNIAEELLHSYDWCHSLIKEVYVVSTSQTHLNNRTNDLGLSSGPTEIRVVVACPGNTSSFGVEFAASDVTSFHISEVVDGSFRFQNDNHHGDMLFLGGQDDETYFYIYARNISARVLARELLSETRILSSAILIKEDIYSSKAVDADYRSCGACANIWEETGGNICRCPECNVLTALVVR